MATLASVILRDIAANRPAAGIAGRLFYDTTNSKLQRDNGSSWDDVAETATGLTNPMTTTGDIIYSSSGSTPARRAVGAANEFLGVSGGLPTWGKATPLGYESFLAAADLTIVNATTWYTSTELQLTPAAGDYLIVAHICLTSASALVTFLGAQISSGGSIASNVLTGQTVIADGGAYNPASNGGGQVSLTLMGKAIGLNGSTVVSVAGVDSRGSSDGKIVKTSIVAGTTNKASSITAIRIVSV